MGAAVSTSRSTCLSKLFLWGLIRICMRRFSKGKMSLTEKERREDDKDETRQFTFKVLIRTCFVWQYSNAWTPCRTYVYELQYNKIIAVGIHSIFSYSRVQNTTLFPKNAFILWNPSTPTTQEVITALKGQWGTLNWQWDVRASTNGCLAFYVALLHWVPNPALPRDSWDWLQHPLQL